MTLKEFVTIIVPGILCVCLCGFALGAALGRIVAWMVTIVALAVGG